MPSLRTKKLVRHAAFASSLSLHDGTNVLPASCPHGGGGGDGEADGGGGDGGGDGEADGGGSGGDGNGVRMRAVSSGVWQTPMPLPRSMPQFGLAVSPHFGSCNIILLLQ